MMQLVLDTDVNEEIKCKMSTIECCDTDEKVMNGTDDHKKSVTKGKLQHLEVCVTGSVNIGSEIHETDENKSVEDNKLIDVSNKNDEFVLSADAMTNGCKESANKVEMVETDNINTRANLTETLENNKSVAVETSNSCEIAEKRDSTETETKTILDEIKTAVIDDTTLEDDVNCTSKNNTSSSMETCEKELGDQIDKSYPTENNGINDREQNKVIVEKIINSENKRINEVSGSCVDFDSSITDKLNGNEPKTLLLPTDYMEKVDEGLESIPRKNDVNSEECKDTVRMTEPEIQCGDNVESANNIDENKSKKNNYISSENLTQKKTNPLDKKPVSDENDESIINIHSSDVCVDNSEKQSEDSRVDISVRETKVENVEYETAQTTENELTSKESSEIKTDIENSEVKVGNAQTPKLAISFDKDTEPKLLEESITNADVKSDKIVSFLTEADKVALNTTKHKKTEPELNILDSTSNVNIVTHIIENNQSTMNTDSSDVSDEKSMKQSEDLQVETLESKVKSPCLETETAHTLEKEICSKDSTENETKSIVAVDSTSEINIPTAKLDINFGDDIETMEIDDDSSPQSKSAEEISAVDVGTDKNVPSKILNTIEVNKEVSMLTATSNNNTSVEIDKPDILKSSSDVESEVLKPNNICKLSNNLDILSDDEEDSNIKDLGPKTPNPPIINAPSKCINLDDDDDVMLIDDVEQKQKETIQPKVTEDTTNDEAVKAMNKDILEPSTDSKVLDDNIGIEVEVPKLDEKGTESPNLLEKLEEKPLVPTDFLKTFKTNVAEMTREDLEEFCLLKIVEGVIDRSSLSEIKTKLKTLTTQLEDWKKKSLMLIKQNRDLQIVLKTVQEEHKNRQDAVAPLKITRSVGMQVFMAEPERGKKKPFIRIPNTSKAPAAVKATNQPPTPVTPTIPVPKLVPAQATPTKGRSPVIQNATVSSNTGKVVTPTLQVAKTPPKQPEKRSHAIMSGQSVTVDLTDDEPPAKQAAPSVRLVSPQSLLAPRAQLQNGPRKVFIPINQNNANLRPGHTVMLKPVPPPQNPRQRAAVTRMPQSSYKIARAPNPRHPAPLPDCLKQQQPPNWKAIPPSPDLKISKVENGIVISWKIVGYQEDSYEEIASYQLYAYQETSSPPSTALWKKIGDVKALPLPMACTLTQFMAGYKYFFAVRAVDVRSRLGPFSLPGSILLLNK